MESLNLKKLLIRSLDWKIIFILHCGYELLTDLYKHFLKFKENVSKYGRITNNSFFGTICTICLGTYNLSKNSFDILINYIYRVVVTFENISQEFYFYMKIFNTRTNFEKSEEKRVE